MCGSWGAWCPWPPCHLLALHPTWRPPAIVPLENPIQVTPGSEPERHGPRVGCTHHRPGAEGKRPQAGLQWALPWELQSQRGRRQVGAWAGTSEPSCCLCPEGVRVPQLLCAVQDV